MRAVPGVGAGELEHPREDMTMRRPRSLLLAAGATALLAATVGVVWAAGSLSAEEQLGKSIFFDQDLSLNRNQSCASCHDPASASPAPTVT